MRRTVPLLGLLVLPACRHGEPADLVLRHGAVYSVATDSAPAQALAVRDGRIVFVGSDREAGWFIGRGTTVLDLEGRMVLPAFRDTHVHVRGGIQLGECTLDALRSRPEVLDSVQRYAALHPELPWIRGSGWQLPVFPEANPRKEWLDRIVPDRPVYLRAADGHSAWVNSRALELAGITRTTPDPPNGRIERDAATGEPSGTLRESAMELVARLLPPRSQAEIRAGLLRAIALANRFGITALYDPSVDPPLLEAYAALDSAGLLTARVIAAIRIDPALGLSQVDSLRIWRARYRGQQYFSPRSVKIFVDGVIEPKTAALLEPYVGGSGYRGEPNFAPAALDTLIAALDGAGFQVHGHAIGDRAVRMALDALAFARRLNGPRDARPIIAHLELIDPADIPRFAAQEVIPSFQPLWAYADDYITRLTEPLLGPTRSRWLYPIGSVARAGARLAAGSDWPVSSLNPLEAIQVAVTRRGPTQPPGPAWIAEEVVSLGTILRAYTLGGAYAAFEEATNGTLEVGKAADLIVLDRDLHRIPASEIHLAKVLLTLLEGRPVWRDPGW
ncbi:MAG TPA: amidohydrolase [Gemmatimonadales bacterium]|nr:amidohydrolase [Gemmatimonadales bacterium]